MKLTNEIFEKGMSSNGGWNRKQERVLGVIVQNKGWKKEIIGRDYPEEVIEKFIALKDAHILKDGTKTLKPRKSTIEDLEQRILKLEREMGIINKFFKIK